MSNVVNAVRDRYTGPTTWLANQLGISTSNTALQLADPSVGLERASKSGAPGTVGNTLKSIADPGQFINGGPSNPKKLNDERDAAIAATPRAPNQDTAANAGQQQADYLRRRRGILGNIFGGNQPNSTPVVAQKQLLGT